MKALISQTGSNNRIFTELKNVLPKSLGAGQVRIKAHYSSINYKDALGVTGEGAIFKKVPLIGGIDVSGEIIESQSPNFKKGDLVLVTGCGLGETHDGGFAEEVIEDDHLVVKVPKNLSTQEAMIFGTAGFTAALSYHRMIQNGQVREMGPIIVTGASGGVGQFAVEIFAKNNFEVWAVSGKPDLVSRLKELGATQVIDPKKIQVSARPLDKGIYGGIVDNVGGELLTGLIPHVNLWGNVASIGLASSADLKTTVMPMILRGVSILGVSSNNTSWDLRLKIWADLAGTLKPKNLSAYVSETVGLAEVIQTAGRMLQRKSHGRTLVKIN